MRSTKFTKTNFTSQFEADKHLLTVSEVGTEQVKVADFVVANGARKENLESAKYLAPEQLEGKMPNYAGDIYSLAIVAYEMIAGRMPFDFTNADQLLKAQKSELIIPLSKVKEGIPPKADEVFRKALAYDPAKRYPKARDFGDALFGILGTVANLPEKEDVIAEDAIEVKSQEPKLNLPSSSVLIPARNNAKSAEDGKQIKIEAQESADESAAESQEQIQIGQSSWERRSPEPVNAGSSMWLLLLGAGVILLAVLSYFSWSYFQNRQNADDTAAVSDNSGTPDEGKTDLNDYSETPPMPREIKQPPNTDFFENIKSQHTGELYKNFRGFSIYYPNTWTKNSPPDSKAKTNFLDISKTNKDGELLEQMIVTYYPGTGLFSKDKELFPKLVEKSNNELKDILGDNFQIIEPGREVKIQGGRWTVFEMTFQSSGESNGQTVTLWGRRFWLPTQNQTLQTGFVVTMLATSLSPDIKGVDDVGNKGDLADILETFEPSTSD